MKYQYGHMEDYEGVTFPDIAQYSGNLVVYGAGVNGLISAIILNNMGVEFLCFSDGDVKKHGTCYCGHDVISPRDMVKKYPNAAVLMTPYDCLNSYRSLCELGCSVILTPVALFLEMDIIGVAREMTSYVDRGMVGTVEDGYSIIGDVDEYAVSEWIDSYLNAAVRLYKKEYKYPRYINLDITDRCTLRCRGCLSHKAYYSSPRDEPWERLEIVLDKLFALDYFQRYHILGGETLLYKDLDKLIRKVTENPVCERVALITNGSVLPPASAIEAMKNEKVFVRISDYGKLSSKINELQALCDNAGIKCMRYAQRWRNFVDVAEKPHDDETAKHIFNNCCQVRGRFSYVLHGKYYWCPFAASVHDLQLIPDSPGDYVDIINEPLETLDASFRNLYSRTTPVEACKYCIGWAFWAPPIPVAEQFTGPAPALPKL